MVPDVDGIVDCPGQPGKMAKIEISVPPWLGYLGGLLVG